MFKQWQNKWKVSPKQFWIIFIAFGCTGISTAYLTKQIAAIAGMDASTWWLWKLLLRIGMLLIGYQVLLLFFGALFGQWKFFWGYEKKLLQKLRILKKDNAKQPGNNIMKSNTTSAEPSDVTVTSTFYKRIAIFASGAGTNAEKIIEHFQGHTTIKVCLVVCNKPEAGVLFIADRNSIATILIEKEKFFRGNGYVEELKTHRIDFIVLAGFLWKIPQTLIDAYRNRIINIHPALLPAYGGKGMYGAKVHEAVLATGDKESGITIHYVDEHYDNGDVILQVKCSVDSDDTAETLANKIHQLEHAHLPKVVEMLVMKAD